MGSELATCRVRQRVSPAGTELRSTLVVLAAGLLLLVLRRPDAFYRPQFWAEDFEFLTSAQRLGIASFWTAQAGYLHFIPRAIAWLARGLPPELQPATFVAASVLVVVAVMRTILSRRLRWPAKPWLALSIVVAPHTGEVFFNPTNCQWFAALALAVTAFKDDPRTVGGWLWDLGLILGAGLSGPFVLLVLPLYFRRAWAHPTRPAVILLGSATLAAMAQLIAVSRFWTPADPLVDARLFDAASMVALRWPVLLTFGPAGATAVARTEALVLGTAIVAMALAAVRLGRVTPTASSRNLDHDCVLLLGFGLLTLAAAHARVRFDTWTYPDVFNGDRYFFIPTVILLWIVIIAIAACRHNVLRLLAGLLLLGGIAMNLPRFQFRPYIDYGWYSACPAIRAGRSVEITVNPDWRYRYQRTPQRVIVERL